MIERLPIEKVRLDGGTQMRQLPPDVGIIREYADALQDGGGLPPVTVFYDGTHYWLSDGFHRYRAHIQLDLRDIDCDVHEGTQRDAILYAVGANANHGVRRTNADKRHAVETLLKDDEWGKWVDAEIARRANVSAMTVGRVRQELISNKVIDSPVERTVQRGGTTYTQQTAKIGQRTTASPEHEDVTVNSYSERPVVSNPAAERLARNMASNDYTPAPVPAPVIDALPLLEPEPVIQAEDLYNPFEAPVKELTNEETERAINKLYSAFQAILKQEHHGRGLLLGQDDYTRSVRSLAYHAREVLDEWLDAQSEKEARTVTVEALN